jgi:DNA-binding NtrC family response regulator
MRAQIFESVTGRGEPLRRSEPEDFAHGPEKFAEARAQRVLVVDDDSLIRWAVGESLRVSGYDVVEASDRTSAMRALTSQKEVDLVFLDLWPADTQDLQVLAAIRQRWPRLPLVLMTAYDSDEIRRKAVKLGVVTVLKKPFDMADIGSVARRALRL